MVRLYGIANLDHTERELHRLMENWWTIDRIKQILLPCINQSSPVSLRLLDWIVTNYSKEYRLVLHHQKYSIHVHEQYRNAMHTWGCKYFAPFRRGNKVVFIFKNEHYSTTLGQLNFMHWCSRTGLLDYALDHLEEIRDHMQYHSKLKQRRKSKRVPLTRSPNQGCYVYVVSSISAFDEDDDDDG